MNEPPNCTRCTKENWFCQARFRTYLKSGLEFLCYRHRTEAIEKEKKLIVKITRW